METETKVINPFDKLSWHCLLFFLERTDFSELSSGFGFGFGFGFATEVRKEIKAAVERKCQETDDPGYARKIAEPFMRKAGG